MNVKYKINQLNQILETKKPVKISPSWVYKNCKSSYMYFYKYVRTDLGEIDWDLITSKLDKCHQRKWSKYGKIKKKRYENQGEVDIILNKYKDKMYTLLSAPSKREQKVKDILIIKFVRASQRGNVLAQKELISWLDFTVQDWVDRHTQIRRWMNHKDELENQVLGCILRYRYTGTFIGYLFKTLELSAYGKPPIVSFDDKFLNGKKNRGDYISEENSYSSM